jgi:hypothetical protein
MITIPTAESIIDISMPIENDIVSDPAAFVHGSDISGTMIHENRCWPSSPE